MWLPARPLRTEQRGSPYSKLLQERARSPCKDAQRVADADARQRLIAHFDWDTTIPETALGYQFDIILRGREQTPMERRD